MANSVKKHTVTYFETSPVAALVWWKRAFKKTLLHKLLEEVKTQEQEKVDFLKCEDSFID